MSTNSGRLKGKVAIVTGSGSRGDVLGNGQATAILFAKEGAKVMLVDASRENLDRTQQSIESGEGECISYVGDVTEAMTCQEVVEKTISAYGKLDILHNNVGIGGSGTVVEVLEEDWDRILEVNIKSMMLMGKYSVPEMVTRGGGAIINISSISAIRPRGLTPYTVSKSGVIALTKAMAVDHAGDGVRVNCILPGPIYSSMTAPNMTSKKRQTRKDASPLKQEGTPWDVAWAAVYLASDESKWVTGASLNVDGGVTLGSPSR
jgi:NAD(P)-dependent dehydrogenase (short-subunit alcohol dehydrogenase family)